LLDHDESYWQFRSAPAEDVGNSVLETLF
jgi:hypothetical protein